MLRENIDLVFPCCFDLYGLPNRRDFPGWRNLGAAKPILFIYCNTTRINIFRVCPHFWLYLSNIMWIFPSPSFGLPFYKFKKFLTLTILTKFNIPPKILRCSSVLLIPKWTVVKNQRVLIILFGVAAPNRSHSQNFSVLVSYGFRFMG